MVAAAVHLMEELSASTREHDGTNWLTRIHRPGLTPDEIRTLDRVYLQNRLRHTLNEFADVVGARQSSDGGVWDFAAHQLRRGFDPYYYHGNRFATLDVLSRFLRHFDPEMTLRYITEALDGALMRLREVVEARSDKVMSGKDAENERVIREAQSATTSLRELAKEHEAVRQDYFVERSLEMYDGIEAPIGLGAATLYAELDEMIEQARRSISTTLAVLKCRSDLTIVAYPEG